MAIEVGDIITISYVERCDGLVIATNIEGVATDNDIYDEKGDYTPSIISVGKDFLARGLHNELVGKEVGAKGTVLVSAEEAYGVRKEEKVHSIDKKQFEKGTQIGSYIRHPQYGTGLVVNKIGPKYIVDFNDSLAGREIEYEYEIHEIITDPAEQFIQITRQLTKGIEIELDVSFEDGKGIVQAHVPLMQAEQWSRVRGTLLWEVFGRLSSTEKIEFKEEYENYFHMKAVSGMLAADEDEVIPSDSDSNLESDSNSNLDSDSDSNLESDSDST